MQALNLLRNEQLRNECKRNAGERNPDEQCSGVDKGEQRGAVAPGRSRRGAEISLTKIFYD